MGIIRRNQLESPLSASYAETASFALNGGGGSGDTSGLVTTASFHAFTASYNTGSFTGSFTGRFFGTASWAISSSYAETASYSQNLQISGSINNVDYIDFNTGSAVPAWKSGRVFWDNTDGALSVYNAEQEVTLQVGQENWTRVSNRTGAPILNGTVVRVKGAHGDVPEVELAQSIAVSGSVNVQNQILGVATHTIEDNSIGYITTQGLVRGLNTNAFTQGDTLFVGTGSAGTLTNVPPRAPYEIIPVGVCVKASPGASGIIYVAVQQPIDFSDLSSVVVSGSYHYGDLWTYVRSGSFGVWTHTNQLSGSYGLTGSLSATAITSSLHGTASWATNALTASAVVVTLSPNTNESLPLIVAYTGSSSGTKLMYIDSGLEYNTLTNALYLPNNGAYVVGNTTIQSSVATFGSDDAQNHIVRITGSLNVSKSVNVDGRVTAGFGANTVGFAGTASWAQSASLAATASSVGQLNQNVTIVGNFNVIGSASYTYVTASQLDVGTQWISVNVAEPGERFGGLRVYDSGSLSHQATASLAWDSQNNHWVYQNASGSTYSGGMLLSGPRNTGSLGDEPSLTRWRVARSDGGDHLNDTQIYSSGSVHQITGSLTVVGANGSASISTDPINGGTRLFSVGPALGYGNTATLDSGFGYLIDGGQVISIWWLARRLYYNNDVVTLDWSLGKTYDTSTTASIDWNNRVLTDTAGSTSVSWDNRTLTDSTGNKILDWESRQLFDNTNNFIVDFSDPIYRQSYNYESVSLTPTQHETFSDNDNYAGRVLTGVTLDQGAPVALYDLVFLRANDNTWYQTRNEIGQQGNNILLGIVVVDNGDGTGNVMIEGDIVVNSNNNNIGPNIQYTTIPPNIGGYLYIAEYNPYLNGQMSTEIGASTGYVRVLGHLYYQNSGNSNQYILRFNPSNDWYDFDNGTGANLTGTVNKVNGLSIYAATASLAQSASLVLVDREAINGPAYLTYTSQIDPSGIYTALYNSSGMYLTGSTFIVPRIESSFTGSLLGTASLATTASYINPTFISASAAASGFGSGGSTGGGTNLGLVYAVSLGYLMP